MAHLATAKFIARCRRRKFEPAVSTNPTTKEKSNDDPSRTATDSRLPWQRHPLLCRICIAPNTPKVLCSVKHPGRTTGGSRFTIAKGSRLPGLVVRLSSLKKQRISEMKPADAALPLLHVGRFKVGQKAQVSTIRHRSSRRFLQCPSVRVNALILETFSANRGDFVWLLSCCAH